MGNDQSKKIEPSRKKDKRTGLSIPAFHLESYKKTAAWKPVGHGLSPGAKSVGTLILDLSAFDTMRNGCSGYPVYGLGGAV